MRSKILKAFGLALMGTAGFGWMIGNATSGGCPPNETCNANQTPKAFLCTTDVCDNQNVGGYCIMCVSS